MINTVSVFIHDHRQVLCAKGFSSRGRFSGIGGKVEPFDERAESSAIRELIEELFNIEADPRHIAHLAKLLADGYIHPQYRTHITFYMDFSSLERLMLELKALGYISPLYASFPTTMSALVLKRKKNVRSELTDLRIVPLVKVVQQPRLYTYEFLADVTQFLKT